jgi:hypothetical protein
MPHSHSEAAAVIGSITPAVFPTPAVAIRTNDPATIATIYGFAEHQAVAARSIATTFLRHVAAAPTRRDTTRAIGQRAFVEQLLASEGVGVR